MTTEERHRKVVFGKDFGIVFGEYLRGEWRGNWKVRTVFTVAVPFLSLIGIFSAVRARSHMLFTGRCW